MKSLITLNILYTYFLLISGCDLFGPGTGLGLGGRAAEIKNKEECKEKRFLWNYDQCIDWPSEKFPELPSLLKNAKIKKMSMGYGVCAIDSLDQLWCLSDYQNTVFTAILPHPDYKFKDISVTFPQQDPETKQKVKNGDLPSSELEKPQTIVCGVLMNNEGICFKNHEDREITKVGSNLKRVIPLPSYETICTIDLNDKVECKSKSKIFNFINKFINNFPAGEKVIDIQTIQTKVDSLDYQHEFIVHTNKNIVYKVYFDSSAKLQMNSYANISSIRYDMYGFLVVQNGFDSFGAYSMHPNLNGSNVPANILNNKLLVADSTLNFACAIEASNNDLTCWGKKKFVDNTPKHKKAKDLYIGEVHLCIVNMDDKLECYDTYGH